MAVRTLKAPYFVDLSTVIIRRIRNSAFSVTLTINFITPFQFRIYAKSYNPSTEGSFGLTLVFIIQEI